MEKFAKAHTSFIQQNKELFNISTLDEKGNCYVEKHASPEDIDADFSETTRAGHRHPLIFYLFHDM